MTSSTSKRAVIYLRVSTEDQSVENQLPELREFARRKGFEIVAEFIDAGISGGTANRVEFQKMFQAAERREFDVLVFWSLDRFTREGVLPTLQHLDRLSKAGVGYASLQEQHFDTANPFNDTFVALSANIAKQEKVRISERTKAGLARVRASGVKLGRPKTDIDVERATELKSQGLSLRAISRAMNRPMSTVRLRLQVV